MKNSKAVLLLSVLAAVLVLGVVYAAITENLSISAEAVVGPDKSNFKVAFTGVTEATGTGDLTNEAGNKLVVTSTNGLTAEFNVAEGALKTVGEYVEATYTIKNTSKDLVATLSEVKIETESDKYVQFTATYGEAGQVLNPVNGTTTVTVRATLMKSTAENLVNASATLKITAEASEYNA